MDAASGGCVESSTSHTLTSALTPPRTSMARRVETLAKIELFRSLNPAGIQRLDTQCSWRRASSKDWIIDYEDQSNDVFFVVSGKVRVKLQAPSGREVILREIKEGEFFGELAAIDKLPRSSGVIALTDVTIARMPALVFRDAVHAHADVCDQLLALLARQIRTLANRVNEFTNLDAKHRIYAEILRLSRPVNGSPKQAVVSPPPAHAEIAARVSIRREAVARELKSLERSGLLERRRGALIIIDVTKLRKAIEDASDMD
jgi:CRP/FNR family cyclic AMP-dependent transcriptional regulator